MAVMTSSSAGSRRVTLRPMTAAEFDIWAVAAIAAYASDVATATGEALEATTARAQEQFPQLLPDGVDTAGTWLLNIVDGDGADVGTLWLGPHPSNPDGMYVWDIVIAEQHRGSGLGRAAMLAAEELAAREGRAEIGLNVFGYNQRAQQLYASLGYRVVSSTMTKPLSPGP